MNYFIEDFSKGKVDLKSSQRITEDYRKKCLKLEDMYVKDNNNIVTRPSVRPSNLNLPFTPTDIVNIEGDNYYFVVDKQEQTTLTEKATINGRGYASIGFLEQKTNIEIYNKDLEKLKEFVLFHYIDTVLSEQLFVIQTDNLVYKVMQTNGYDTSENNLSFSVEQIGIFTNPNISEKIYKYNNIGLFDVCGVRYKIEDGKVLTSVDTETLSHENYNKEFIDKFNYSAHKKPKVSELKLMVRTGVSDGTTGFDIKTFEDHTENKSILEKSLDFAEFAISHYRRFDTIHYLLPDIKITERDSATGAGNRYLFSEGEDNVFATDVNIVSAVATKLQSLPSPQSRFPEGIGYSIASIGFSIVVQRNNTRGADGSPIMHPEFSNARSQIQVDKYQGDRKRYGTTYHLFDTVDSYDSRNSGRTQAVYHIFLDYPNNLNLLDDLKIINFIDSQGQGSLNNFPLIQVTTPEETPNRTRFDDMVARNKLSKIDYRIPYVVSITLNGDGSRDNGTLFAPVSDRYMVTGDYDADHNEGVLLGESIGQSVVANAGVSFYVSTSD